jgi:dsRNA-specific ribonuclease
MFPFWDKTDKEIKKFFNINDDIANWLFTSEQADNFVVILMSNLLNFPFNITLMNCRQATICAAIAEHTNVNRVFYSSSHTFPLKLMQNYNIPDIEQYKELLTINSYSDENEGSVLYIEDPSNADISFIPDLLNIYGAVCVLTESDIKLKEDSKYIKKFTKLGPTNTYNLIIYISDENMGGYKNMKSLSFSIISERIENYTNYYNSDQYIDALKTKLHTFISAAFKENEILRGESQSELIDFIIKDEQCLKLWIRSFTHSSFAGLEQRDTRNFQIKDYETLETEGDKILGSVFMHYLIQTLERLGLPVNPDTLTQFNFMYMSNEFQALSSARFGLTSLIRMFGKHSQIDINEDIFESFFSTLYNNVNRWQNGKYKDTLGTRCCLAVLNYVMAKVQFPKNDEIDMIRNPNTTFQTTVQKLGNVKTKMRQQQDIENHTYEAKLYVSSELFSIINSLAARNTAQYNNGISHITPSKDIWKNDKDSSTYHLFSTGKSYSKSGAISESYRVGYSILKSHGVSHANAQELKDLARLTGNQRNLTNLKKLKEKYGIVDEMAIDRIVPLNVETNNVGVTLGYIIEYTLNQKKTRILVTAAYGKDDTHARTKLIENVQLIIDEEKNTT